MIFDNISIMTVKLKLIGIRFELYGTTKNLIREDILFDKLWMVDVTNWMFPHLSEVR